MRKTSFYCFGVDIGGTFTKIGLFKIDISNLINKKDEPKENYPLNIYLNIDNFFINIKLIESFKIRTQDPEKSEYFFVNSLYESFKKILSKNNINLRKPIAFSFATPGFPDNKVKKVVGGAFNIPFLDKIEFENYISKFQSSYLYLNLINDVTSQGYYEQNIKKEIFKTEDDIALLIALGTGIGGAIFTKDKVIGGSNGWAAEFGHLPLWFSKLGGKKNLCTCGKINCSEVYGSVGSYVRMLKGKGKNISAEEALNLYIKNEADRDIMEITEFWIDSLSALSATLINIFNPSAIIISGAISKVAELSKIIYKNTEKYANKYLFEGVKFYNATSSDLAGAFGAVIHGIKSEFHVLKEKLWKKDQ
ncbi:MAG: ROK family protein [Spirochaetales bacterium]|jgi:predicted NBD/HSP70 family sugar kinase|nr:ROK family protein [Exilispira sp.]NMC66802.1 ROK family protein [Spirochaetales bacterium]